MGRHSLFVVEFVFVLFSLVPGGWVSFVVQFFLHNFTSERRFSTTTYLPTVGRWWAFLDSVFSLFGIPNSFYQASIQFCIVWSRRRLSSPLPASVVHSFRCFRCLSSHRSNNSFRPLFQAWGPVTFPFSVHSLIPLVRPSTSPVHSGRVGGGGRSYSGWVFCPILIGLLYVNARCSPFRQASVFWCRGWWTSSLVFVIVLFSGIIPSWLSGRFGVSIQSFQCLRPRWMPPFRHSITTAFNSLVMRVRDARVWHSRRRLNRWNVDYWAPSFWNCHHPLHCHCCAMMPTVFYLRSWEQAFCRS